MPEPFAMPPIVTCLASTSISAASSFSQVSVVIIALAASVPFSIVSFFFRPALPRLPGSGHDRKLISDDSCRAKSTPSAEISQSLAAATAVSLAIAKPFCSCTCIGNSGIDNDRLNRSPLPTSCLVPFDRSSFYHIRRKCSCRHTRYLTVDQGPYLSALILDLAAVLAASNPFAFVTPPLLSSSCRPPVFLLSKT